MDRYYAVFAGVLSMSAPCPHRRDRSLIQVWIARTSRYFSGADCTIRSDLYPYHRKTFGLQEPFMKRILREWRVDPDIRALKGAKPTGSIPVTRRHRRFLAEIKTNLISVRPIFRLHRARVHSPF